MFYYTQLFDLTGNLREVVKAGTNIYPLMGGSYLTEVEDGASCNFSFMVAEGAYMNRDTGFRYCFNRDPRL